MLAGGRAQALLKDSQLSNDRLQKEYNLLTDKVSKMQQTLEEHIHTNTRVRTGPLCCCGSAG